MKRFWRLGYYFLLGDRGWGLLRLLAVLFLAVCTTLFFIYLFEFPRITNIVYIWYDQFPNLVFLPKPILYLFAGLFASLTESGCRRYFVVPLVATVGAFLVGARYVQDIYELKSFGPALRYLIASVFSIFYPRLLITQGKMKVEPDQTNLLQKIGGPGYVIISPGSAVLFERLSGFSNICAAGVHFVPRHETIREIISLEDQHGYTESITAFTKDGIEVRVREVHYRYRVRTGRFTGDYTRRTPEEPYPYSVEAIRNMAYKRTVSANGLTSWHDAVSIVINGVITDYISQHQFDHLTAPRYGESDPREEIQNIVNSKQTRDRLKDLGADLLWFDLGHFEIVDKNVIDQHVETWQAKWIGNARLQEALGEAQRMANQELGRAEAQSTILLGILHALEDAGLSEDPSKNLRNVILARTAQLLDTLMENNPPKLPQG